MIKCYTMVPDSITSIAPSHSGPRINMKSRRILVFRTGQLGDTLVAVPALKGIRAHWPDAEISYLYDLHYGKNYINGKEVLQGSGLINRFIPYPIGYTFFEKTYAFLSMLRLLFGLRRKRYELVINLVQPPRNKFQLIRDQIFFRVAGIRRQIVAAPLESRGAISDSRPLKRIGSEAEFLWARVLEKLPEAATSLVVDPKLDSSKSEQTLAEYWLNKNVPSGISYCLGVAIGSKMQSKIWPEEFFGDVLLRLWKKHRVWPIFLGSSADKEASQRIQEYVGAGSLATGVFSIRESLALLRNCDFYLGNDTGTMHLAVAAGRKCVALFSARDQPGRWYPSGSGHSVHRKAVDCEGCMLQICTLQGRKCLTQIKPDEVYDSCIQMLHSLRH